MDKHYVVIPTNEIKQSMIRESGTEVSVRESLDGTLSILCFCCKYPETMAGYDKYTHEEIKSYVVANIDNWEITVLTDG